ncbi:MAG: EAL domain-containing protein [Mycobacterium sp.]
MAEPSHPLSRARDRFSVMFEITERGLLDHPSRLLSTVEALRAQGFLIALDDVGAFPDSSALLDIIAPDVIKLDLSFVQSQPDYRQAQTLSSVIAHHERTGAVILAEGIETDQHLEQALALGADLGQGYMFGRPAEPDHRLPTGAASLQPATSRSTAGTVSPFALIKDHHRVRTARKATVMALSQHIEMQASRAVDPPIVLTGLQRAEFLTKGTFKRYVNLAERSPLVAIFGLQMPPGLDGGIRGIPLAADDPLCDEWTVVVLGPQTAAAIIARESPDGPQVVDDSERRFDFVITYDRALVTEAARTLLNRVD